MIKKMLWLLVAVANCLGSCMFLVAALEAGVWWWLLGAVWLFMNFHASFDKLTEV